MMISTQFTPTPNKIPIPIQKPSVFTCISCKVKFESGETQRIHFKSEWHKYNLKRKVCNLPAIDLRSFEAIQAAVPEKEKIPPKVKDVLEPKLEPSSSSSHQHDDRLSSRDEDEGDDDDDDDDEWADLDEEEEEEEVAEMLARVVKPNTCLFCGKTSSNLRQNLQHMDTWHRFFVPEERYVIDMEGLVEYLGYKVGAGATCLWCNKEFTSLHGVRLHMIYKDHCKIHFNQETAVREFKDFYDYSSQDTFDMKPLEKLVVAKRRTSRNLPTQNKNLIHATGAPTKQLTLRRGPGFVVDPKLVRSSRHFYSRRAKLSVNLGVSSNQTMRGRIRQQNPI